MISKKIILLGKYGVGKTSLTNRFVHSKFSEEYLTTIGVNIEKKVVHTSKGDISLIIWDIAGESSQSKVSNTYKLGAAGILYVVDLSRPTSYESLPEEIEELAKLLPNVPVIVLGNKKDLFTENQLQELDKKIKFSKKLFTSAKTGDEVEQAFSQLAELIV
ncbi:MAG: Rab family GTPase [Cyclobacteriaceae bacterium]